MVKLDLLEDVDNEATLDILIGDCMEDYPDNDQLEMAQYAAKIARASITDQTRDKHVRCVSLARTLSLQILDNAQRIIKAFLTFHLKHSLDRIQSLSPNRPYMTFTSLSLTSVIPSLRDTRGESIPLPYLPVLPLLCGFTSFILRKGWMSGLSMRSQASGEPLYSLVLGMLFTGFSWALSSSGLPTRARVISEFMIDLEKMKARSGEVFQSACALMLEDIYCLYHHCVGQDKSSKAKKYQGIVCYVSIVLLL